MKKSIISVIIIILVVCLGLLLVACGQDDNKVNAPSQASETPKRFEGVTFESKQVEYDGHEHTLGVVGIPQGANVTYQANKGTAVGTYQATATVTKEGYETLVLTATLRIDLPSAESVVAARAKANSVAQIGYDFGLNLAGTVNIAGYQGTANANYDGKYRLNKQDGTYQFMRTTSGLLLYDATQYTQLLDGNRLVVTANDKGVVKMIDVLTDDKEEALLINKPIVAFIDSLNAENIKEIALSGREDYMFKASLRLTADNALLRKALGIVAKQGGKLSMKGISLTNPVSGLQLLFNLSSDGTVQDFAIGAEVSFPVSGAAVKLQLNYRQNASATPVTAPQIGTVSIAQGAIQQDIDHVASAIANVKQSATYSLDLAAKNEFDAGWNHAAIVDQYNARMYKNTYMLDGSGFVAFNHSYEYKTHHDADGKETYQYTIGNIQDNSVYLVSRKGTNEVSVVDNVDVDTQFDYLTDILMLQASDVACIQKKTSGNTVVFTIYATSAYTIDVNNKVAQFINSNQAEGVIAVNNYFNEADYAIKASSVQVTVTNGVLVSVDIETDIQYQPIAGDYANERITLTDVLSLTVNKEADKAAEYTAPKSATTAVVGLKASKYYIQ